MDAVLNNPFRVLGLSTKASDKEITKRISDLSLYAEMGKKIKFDSDCEFLGEVDRSLSNIKEAAKRLENNDLKLFYSLMWFEIKDEIDKTSLESIKNFDFERAVILWKKSIFCNCPIKYCAENIINVQKNADFIEKITPYYSITYADEYTLNSRPSLKKNYFITTFFEKGQIHAIKETFTKIDLIDMYQISFSFLFTQPNDIEKKIAICLSRDESDIRHRFSFNSKGFFIFESINTHDNTSKLICESYIEDYHQSINFIVIKKYLSRIEIWFAGINVYTNLNVIPYTTFHLEVSGLQSIMLNNFHLQKIKKSTFNSDIEINDKTFNYLKNLTISYLIQTEYELKLQYESLSGTRLKSQSDLNFLGLFGLYYKQDYFSEYAKEIISDNYIVDFSKLSELIIAEFYIQYKKMVLKKDKQTDFTFLSRFSHLSNEARRIAEEKIFSSRVFEFEALIQEVSNQRISKLYNYSVLSKNLYQTATTFFKWYSTFRNWENISYSKLQDNVAKEILECAISYYNFSPKNIQEVDEAIQIIKLSAEFSRSMPLRDRIEKNLEIITKLHGLEKINIDFKKMDDDNYLNYYNYRFANNKPKIIKP